jgi:aldose 1-epimerase
MELLQSDWGRVGQQPSRLYTVTDRESGFQVSISDLGASIVRVIMPDRNGNTSDIAFGQNSAEELIRQGGHLGSTVGRVAGRIANAKFTLDGIEHRLSANAPGGHSLHGGKEGFDKMIWTLKLTKALRKENSAALVFEYTSPDGEEGYPGKLKTLLTYRVTRMELAWEFIAKTDKPTIVNLTNHSYWNLDGLDALIDGLQIRLESSHYMPADQNRIPTGEIKNVTGTPLDLRVQKAFSRIFSEHGDVDDVFLLDGFAKKTKPEGMFYAGEILSPNSGRRMEMYTTEPCLVVYTGNSMGSLKSFGKACRKHSAVCLEDQRPPNAINDRRFSETVILRPDETYYHRTLLRFRIGDRGVA